MKQFSKEKITNKTKQKQNKNRTKQNKTKHAYNQVAKKAYNIVYAYSCTSNFVGFLSI